MPHHRNKCLKTEQKRWLRVNYTRCSRLPGPLQNKLITRFCTENFKKSTTHSISDEIFQMVSSGGKTRIHYKFSVCISDIHQICVS